MLLPYDARIGGGPCDGGHVVAVETGPGPPVCGAAAGCDSRAAGRDARADYQALARNPRPPCSSASGSEEERQIMSTEEQGTLLAS